MSDDEHPIKVGGLPGQTLEQRVARVEEYLARHHDQLWWMNLPPERRKRYEAEGFSDPMQHYFGPKA